MTGLALPEACAIDDEDARLESLFRDYLEETMRARPMFATRLGDHRFDDRIDDLSKEARATNLERDRRTLESLQDAVSLEKLSRDGEIDYEVFRSDLARSIWLQENFQPFEDDPRIWGEYLTESVYLPLTQSSLPRDVNLANSLERMRQIPAIVDVARRTIGNPPRVMVETAILQTEGAIDFYESGFYELVEAQPGDPAIAARAAPVVAALREHKSFLESVVMPRANGEWRIGREKFDRKLALELDAGIAADDLLAEAESEAARVEREMAVLARQLWSTYEPKKPIPTDDEAGRRLMIQAVLRGIGDDRSTSETVVNDVKNDVEGIKKFIRDRRILTLPEPDRCRIVTMPDFLRGNSTAYLSPAPPLDPAGSSEYAVSPPPVSWSADRVESYFREYNRQMLKILSIHEGYPGHYVQLEYSNRCPSFIRRVLGSGTFAEGWAVYSEQMMLDQGYGDGDPNLRMQQLKFYLRAVVNAILDHRMHCSEMSDEQAMGLLMNRAFQTEGEAVGKIRRAKQSSCQLSTYFAGRTAFWRLRQTIQRMQGQQFDLAKYHEAALAHGTVPVRHLQGLVTQFLGLPPAH
jgi:uncharacterized protein (DUF885 family)